jgi:hypothetical protein
LQKLISDKVVRFKPEFWLKLGGLIPKWIKDDALMGKMQNNGQGYHYRSKSYMKYKANAMRRFTKGQGKTFSDKEGFFYGQTYFKNKKAGINKKTGHTTGSRLSGYETVPIQSTDVSKVNMVLTGRTLDSLHPKTSDDTSVTMAFGVGKGGIVLGNKQRGYNVIGLSNDNKKKVRNLILAQLDNNLKKEIGKTIVINIG